MPTTRFFIKCKRQKRREMKFGTLEKKVHASSCQLAVILIIIMLANLCLYAAVDDSSAATQRIGKRIRQNECGGTISGVTFGQASQSGGFRGHGPFSCCHTGEPGSLRQSSPEQA